MDTTNKFLLPAAVIVAGLLVAGAVIWNGSSGPKTGSTATTTGSGAAAAPNVNIANVKTAGEPYIGSPNAPVTIAEWSDYQCPFCKEYELSTLPQIVQNYVNQGKVRIVFKDFAFLGPDSQVDAEWARAVWALYPKQFLAWRNAIYSNEPQENSMNASQNLAFLKKTTGGVSGIDLAKVETNVSANKAKYDAAINADKSEAAQFGINATPSFVIGKQMIAGAYPYNTFQSAIQTVLGSATTTGG